MGICCRPRGQRVGFLYKSLGQAPTNNPAQENKNKTKQKNQPKKPAPIGINRFLTKGRGGSGGFWVQKVGNVAEMNTRGLFSPGGRVQTLPGGLGEDVGGVWMPPEEGNRAGSDSCQPRGSGIVLSGEKEPQGRPPGSLQLPQEDMS